MQHEERPSRSRAIEILIEALGIDHRSYEAFVEWALAEHLVSHLARVSTFTPAFFTRPDALKKFGRILEERTHRSWSREDSLALFHRVQVAKQKHYRERIKYEDLLSMLWTLPLVCVRCKREPPEVVLHVDHIVPVAQGGSSGRRNLQYLCAEDNLGKGARREVEPRWLDFA